MPVARFANIAAAATAAYVVGNNVASLTDTISRASALTVWELGGGDLGRPSGSFVFGQPRAGVDAAGRLHIVWAEPGRRTGRTEPAQWFAGRWSSIWTARYTPGRGWSTATRLYSGAIDWDKSSSDELVSANGRLYMAAPLLAEANDVLYLEFDGEAWAAIPITVGAAVAYTSVAVHADTVVLGFVAADRASPLPDRNSIFVTKSVGPGRSWSAPSLLRRSGRDAAYDLRLRTASDGTLHVLWSQELGSHRHVLRHIISDSNLASGTLPADLPVVGDVNAPQATIDHHGRVQMTYEHRENENADWHIDHVVWDGRWSRPTHIFPGYRATDIALRTLADGRVVLVMLAQPARSPSNAPIQTLYSELRE